MAWQATAWAWSLTDIPFGNKLVLLALADMADEEFSCFPGQRRLSSMTSMSVSTVARALEALAEGGFIRREPRHRDDGSRTSDRFYLLVDPPFRLTGGSLQIDGAKNLPSESKNNTARATQWPDDFRWNNSHALKAQAKGVMVDVEFMKFMDYCLARGSTYKDWDRAFHSWLNNARPMVGKRADTSRPGRDEEIRAFLGQSLGDETKGIGR